MKYKTLHGNQPGMIAILKVILNFSGSEVNKNKTYGFLPVIPLHNNFFSNIQNIFELLLNQNFQGSEADQI